MGPLRAALLSFTGFDTLRIPAGFHSQMLMGTPLLTLVSWAVEPDMELGLCSLGNLSS